jgi:hypothetical protein
VELTIKVWPTKAKTWTKWKELKFLMSKMASGPSESFLSGLWMNWT